MLFAFLCGKTFFNCTTFRDSTAERGDGLKRGGRGLRLVFVARMAEECSSEEWHGRSRADDLGGVPVEAPVEGPALEEFEPLGAAIAETHVDRALSLD